MVKYTKTIRRQQHTKCLSVFDRFVGMAVEIFLNLLKSS